MTNKEKQIYNKALYDVLDKAKFHGLFSTECGFSDLMAYENGNITEDELWERYDKIAIMELNSVIEDLIHKID